ncbi:MAG: hypothetical protein JW839_19515 [Candidatus Lokiarchaeota archaeon]|nr:hypothetical protein [Candidatus Lokiarchaeota archaeon]
MSPTLRIHFLVDCGEICERYPDGCADCWKDRLLRAGIPLRDYVASMEQIQGEDIEGSRDLIYRKYQDVLNIKSLMVLTKGGVCVYNHPVTGAGMDANLVAGFLQANIAFSQEGVREQLPQPAPADGGGKAGLDFALLDRDAVLSFDAPASPEQASADTSQNLVELNYQKFVLLVHEALHIRSVLVLDHQPSFSLRNLLVSFSSYFERVYGEALAQFVGEVSLFEDARVIVEKVFETDLLFPYSAVLISPTDQSALGSLEQLVYKSGLDRTQTSGFFFIGSLVEELKGMLQKPARDIVHDIYELVKKEYFVPQQLETAAKYIEEVRTQRAEREKAASPTSAMYGKAEAEEIQALNEELKTISEKDAKNRFKKYMAAAAARLEIGIHADAMRNYELARVVAKQMAMSREIEQATTKIQQLKDTVLMLEYNNAMKLAVTAEKGKEWLKAVQHYTACKKLLIDGFGYDAGDKRVKEIDRRIGNMQVKVR